MESITIFYSWQSDRPNSENRGFIQSCLDRAAKTVNGDDEAKHAVVIDRDTQGVPGSPAISETILQKIQKCDHFVADVSIIGTAGNRPTPNPNVMLEIGYAISELGPDRVTMVMNTVHGGPDLLPFDLRHRRTIPYVLAPDSQDKPEQKNRLICTFVDVLRAVTEERAKERAFEAAEPAFDWVHALESLRNSSPSRSTVVEQSLGRVWAELGNLAPSQNNSSSQYQDDSLIDALGASLLVIARFAEFVKILAITEYHQGIIDVVKSFSLCVQEYSSQAGAPGAFLQARADFFRFVGHEMFLVLVSKLVRAAKWELLAAALGEDLYLANGAAGQRMINFERISDFIELLKLRRNRLGTNRISVHSDLLHERHKNGMLADIAPFSEILEADFLLYMRTRSWRPWSTVYIYEETPRFLVESNRKAKANLILPVVGCDNIDDLRARVRERNESLSGFWQQAVFGLRDFDINSIGSM